MKVDELNHSVIDSSTKPQVPAEFLRSAYVPKLCDWIPTRIFWTM